MSSNTCRNPTMLLQAHQHMMPTACPGYKTLFGYPVVGSRMHCGTGTPSATTSTGCCGMRCSAGGDMALVCKLPWGSGIPTACLRAIDELQRGPGRPATLLGRVCVPCTHCRTYHFMLTLYALSEAHLAKANTSASSSATLELG